MRLLPVRYSLTRSGAITQRESASFTRGHWFDPVSHTDISSSGPLSGSPPGSSGAAAAQRQRWATALRGQVARSAGMDCHSTTDAAGSASGVVARSRRRWLGGGAVEPARGVCSDLARKPVGVLPAGPLANGRGGGTGQPSMVTVTLAGVIDLLPRRLAHRNLSGDSWPAMSNTTSSWRWMVCGSSSSSCLFSSKICHLTGPADTVVVGDGSRRRPAAP